MFSDSNYQAARHHAASLDRSERGRIVVSGADRASYLHGLLTNDVASLKAGEGCYAAYLTPQGRMITDLFVYELGDVILLTIPREQTRLVLEKLDQFIFSEDVQLGDASDAFHTMAVIGPEAAAVVSGATGISEEEVAGLPEHGNRRGQIAGHPVIVTRITDTGEAGYDLHIESSQADALREALLAAGVPALDALSAEAIRVEVGVPRFNQDMNEDTIPLEAGIESRAISFSKGCYVGQEVIIRVLHRGHGRVARKLVGLRIEGTSAPQPGAIVTADGRDIGHVTSGAYSPALETAIALAYLQRDFLAPGTAVSVGGEPAVVSELPFVQSARLAHRGSG